MEQLFYNTTKDNRVDEVTALLRIHPDLDVNWSLGDTSQWTALHTASYHGYTEVVKLLLTHPAINVNKRDTSGYTPLHCACFFARLPVVRVLLEDPRVDASLSGQNGRTPLSWASHAGYHEVVKWLIASGKNLGDLNKKAQWPGVMLTPLEIAVEKNRTEVVSLLERFIANPEKTRHQIRVELGVLNVQAAAHFATIIFLCDGLLQVKGEEKEKESAAARFFDIAQRLPMELQIILVNRTVGSVKDSVLSRDSEPAFKELAKSLLLS